MSVERQLMMASGGVVSYQIANSLRFRSSASAYLNRTQVTPTNQKLFTYSFWVKPSLLQSGCNLFEGYVNDTNRDSILFSSYSLRFVVYQSSILADLITTQIFRDPSAWYHIVVSYDSTQASASNRVKIYVNGVQVTSFSTSTYPSQNQTTYLNAANAGVVGRSNYSSGSLTTTYFDGYMADINFIDGQALTPTSFGAFDTTTGVWKPKSYAGTYGTNGFHLNFSNGTSTTTLGYDSSGNSNNWTTNNISLTAGSTYDWMIDSPTPYQGTSYGVGNYAVLNPLDKGSDITASDGNLSISWGGVNGHSIRDSIAMSAGQWYCEFTMGTSSVAIGLIYQNITGVGSGSGWPGSSTFGVGGSYGYANSGNKYTNSVSTAYGASYTTGDVIGVAFDATSGTLTFYKNGSSQGTAFTGISGAYCFAIGYFGGSTGGTPAYANFGQRPFAYTPPSGYKSLCTYNLPTPTIQNGANQMQATTYTGTGATLSIATTAFQPDLVWIKSRSAATDNKLTDSVRGATNALVSNSTAAATTDAGGVTAFNSTGFTIGTTAAYNTNAATYVAWQWKAGGTAVTNTAGSITSSVSANTTAGFSVVTYTGNGVAGATIGHGLGIAPSMVIVKPRVATTTADGWCTGHTSIGWGSFLELNSTNAATAASNRWNSTAPTSSVVTLGSVITDSGKTFVAYCFAAIPGYSAFGSYTGNGSADGPFVYCGFRPRFILVKRSTTAGAAWNIVDSSRNTYNVANAALYPNLSNAESTTNVQYDLLSNGFKVKDGASGDDNLNGATYIYAAFAENPFNYSLAR